MTGTASIFTEINLPNAATWFYFSALLAVALFFKFTRLLSVRNWDVLTLYLLVPGLILLEDKDGRQVWAYLWLVGSSAYFFVRCLIDLTLVRRPSLRPNLNLAGLAWLAGALYVSLIAVAANKPNDNAGKSQPPNLIDPARKVGEKYLSEQAPPELVGLWVERGLTLLCHLSIVAGLVLIGRRHFEDQHAGMAAATFYLLLPYAWLLMPGAPSGVGGWDHAWPMALMIWMVLAYRRPAVAGAFLGVAAGTTFFPVLTLPVWLSFYWRRGAGRFGLAFVLAAVVCLGALGGVLWFNRELPQSLQSIWSASGWQPWKQPAPSARGLWQDMPGHWAYRVPVFIAYVTFIVTTAIWPSPKNLAHVLALSAAALIGIQFWYPDRGGVYILWYLPFLLLLVFRPNLSACQPPPPADTWVERLGRRLRRAVLRLLHRPEPAAPVA
ncbi:MAG TPA: hypothetical protein VFE78_06325 [Gemmataceae bacterium]|jgi:hypothetical protein|nr:hypothetical protein [Gemmataceae bacterium]